MDILVLSDSHGKDMCELYRTENVRAVIFLGDGLHDAELLSRITGHIPVYRVRGNCDFFDVDTQDELLFELGGKRIFMTHGHKYSVKSGYGVLENIARARGADIALFGHTHIRHYEKTDGLILANPGSFRDGHYGILTIDKQISFRHGDIYDKRTSNT